MSVLGTQIETSGEAANSRFFVPENPDQSAHEEPSVGLELGEIGLGKFTIVAGALCARRMLEDETVPLSGIVDVMKSSIEDTERDLEETTLDLDKASIIRADIISQREELAPVWRLFRQIELSKHIAGRLFLTGITKLLYECGQLPPEGETQIGSHVYTRRSGEGIFVMGANSYGKTGWLAFVLNHGKPPKNVDWVGFAAGEHWDALADDVLDSLSIDAPGITDDIHQAGIVEFRKQMEVARAHAETQN